MEQHNPLVFFNYARTCVGKATVTRKFPIAGCWH